MHCTVAAHETPLGVITSLWSSGGLYRLQWGEPSQPTTARSSRVIQLNELLQNYFDNGADDFHQVEVDATGWTDFRRRIFACCREIEPGQTISYGQLAKRAGRARAGRAVGTAMKNNRIPLVIPCHRVIASGGRIGGYGSPGGVERKRMLLRLEGVVIG